MPIKVNCEFRQGLVGCSNEMRIEKFLGFYPHIPMCVYFDGRLKCEFQSKYPRPSAPPPCPRKKK